MKLTIEANKKCVDYLDVTLDLRSGTFQPFTKPKNIPQMPNTSTATVTTSHRYSAAYQMPSTEDCPTSYPTNNRLTQNQEALKNSGYDTNLISTPNHRNQSAQEARTSYGLIRLTVSTSPPTSATYSCT